MKATGRTVTADEEMPHLPVIVEGPALGTNAINCLRGLSLETWWMECGCDPCGTKRMLLRAEHGASS